MAYQPNKNSTHEMGVAHKDRSVPSAGARGILVHQPYTHEPYRVPPNTQQPPSAPALGQEVRGTRQNDVYAEGNVTLRTFAVREIEVPCGAAAAQRTPFLGQRTQGDVVALGQLPTGLHGQREPVLLVMNEAVRHFGLSFADAAEYIQGVTKRPRCGSGLMFFEVARGTSMKALGALEDALIFTSDKHGKLTLLVIHPRYRPGGAAYKQFEGFLHRLKATGGTRCVTVVGMHRSDAVNG